MIALRRPLAVSFGAVAVVAAACALAASTRSPPVSTAGARPKPAVAVRGAALLPPAPSVVTPTPSGPFARLPELTFVHGAERESLRLYGADGSIDESAAARLDRLLADERDPKNPIVVPINRRTLQLIFRAAYHFAAREVVVVSGYRRPGRRREGYHARGDAVDFSLPGVKAAELASYLRKTPRAGVGVYTHPKTQFVHLDCRPESFHWLDASPPRRRWRERSLRTPNLPALDASYAPALDLPEKLPEP